MRKTYLRLGALLLMCASGMNSFAVDFVGHKFTVGTCTYQVTKNDPKPEDDPKETYGNVILLSVGSATSLDYSSDKAKSVVTDDPNKCDYQVVGIVGATVKKKDGSYIEDGAFKDATSDITITLGKQMTEIGANAFSFLGANITITFEKGVQLEEIGQEAFMSKIYTNKTVKITPTDKLLDLTKATTLGEGAFEGVDFGNSGVKFGDIKDVPNRLFKGATNLATVEFEKPTGLERIGDEAFSGATGITKFGCPDNGAYFLPTSLTVVGHGAFKGALTKNDLQFAFSNFATNAQITNVGNEAFMECTALDDSKFKSLFKGFKGLTYGTYAFAKCSLEEELDLSDGGNDIPIGAFKDNDLKKVTFPDGLKTIGAEAFMDNNKLGAKDEEGKENPILIPSRVTKIGRYAFKRSTEDEPTTKAADFATAEEAVEKCEKSAENYSSICDDNVKAPTVYFGTGYNKSDFAALLQNVKDNLTSVKKNLETCQEVNSYITKKFTIDETNKGNLSEWLEKAQKEINATLTVTENGKNNDTNYNKLKTTYKDGVENAFNTLTKLFKDLNLTSQFEELKTKLTTAKTSAETALADAKGDTPARKIYILPAETEDGRANQAVVQCTYYEIDNGNTVTTAGSPIDTYENTTLFVPMGLQKEYFTKNAAYDWDVPKGKLFTYGQELNANDDIYDGAFKYQVTADWNPEYSDNAGYSESPVVKLVGINKDNISSGYTATFYKYTDDKKQNIAGDIDLVVPDTIGQSKEKIYVYYTVAGIGNTMSTMLGAYNTDKVKSAKIEANVTELIAGLFQGCKKLTEFDIPETVTTIGANAFAGTDLTEINIPASVQTIGANAFEGKRGEDGKSFVGVRTFHLNWTSAPSGIDENAFGGIVSYYDLEQREIYLPRYAVMETNNALSAFTTGDGYGKPFNNKNMFQVGEGIIIQYANGNPEFLNVDVTSTGGTTTRKIGFTDANDITLLVVSKDIQADVTYTRDFKTTNLQAWYVPFQLDADQKKGAKFYMIQDTKVVEDADGNPATSLELVPVADDAPIKANVPYIVKPAAKGSIEFTANGLVRNQGKEKDEKGKDTDKPVCKSVTVADVDNVYTISGTYAEYKADTNGDGKIDQQFYGLNNGSFQNATAKASMKACRIYMTKTGNESPYVKLHIMGDEEDETAILNMETGEVSPEAMYDLSGRRISSPVKGQIYIQGNVKKLAR